jgi:hypothetical protein
MEPAAGMLVKHQGEWIILKKGESRLDGFYHYYTNNTTPLLPSPAAVPDGVTLWDVLKTQLDMDGMEYRGFWQTPHGKLSVFDDGRVEVITKLPPGIVSTDDIYCDNLERLLQYRKTLKAYIAQKGWK